MEASIQMAKITDRPRKPEPRNNDREAASKPFAEIDADHLERARRDPAIRRFADAADRYVAALRRVGRLP
jgi:hypothetical protein